MISQHQKKVSSSLYKIHIKTMEKMREEKSSNYDIAMFPWFATGHMTPFLHLSNKLAEKGHKISFLLPNKAKLQLEHHNLHPSLITFHLVTVPHVDGLPLGTETASDIPLFLNGLLATAVDLMRDQITDLLQKLKPNFVFYDMAYWISELAPQIGFKTVNYNVVSASSIAIALVPSRIPHQGDRSSEDIDLSEPPAGYPSSPVVLKEHEAKSLSFIFLEFGKGISFYKRITTALKNCDAIAIRTCKEVEGQFCDYISKEYKKQVFLTGPILPEPGKDNVVEEQWGNWLNGFNKGEVVFCAFGSQLVLEKDQFQELVLGFELTNLPFLVAVKPPFGCESIEEGLPEGFKERVKGRGVVYGGWVQQPKLLNHPSVGCFVNHCGFGSMWESLMSDCQIVIVPHLGDQILNARLLAHELKVGVEVERDENGWFSKEGLCKGIKSAMDVGSDVGALVKNNHKMWKETLTKPSFMDNYIESFMQNLHRLHE